MEESITFETEQSKLLNDTPTTPEAEKDTRTSILGGISASKSLLNNNENSISIGSPMKSAEKKEKKKKSKKDDQNEEIKFSPTILKKYRALIWLNLHKLQRNYLSSVCMQMILPVAILIIPAVISGVILSINLAMMMFSMILGFPLDGQGQSASTSFTAGLHKYFARKQNDCSDISCYGGTYTSYKKSANCFASNYADDATQYWFASPSGVLPTNMSRDFNKLYPTTQYAYCGYYSQNEGGNERMAKTSTNCFFDREKRAMKNEKTSQKVAGYYNQTTMPHVKLSTRADIESMRKEISDSVIEHNVNCPYGCPYTRIYYSDGPQYPDLFYVMNNYDRDALTLDFQMDTPQTYKASTQDIVRYSFNHYAAGLIYRFAQYSTAAPQFKNTTSLLKSTINTYPQHTSLMISQTWADPFNLLLIPLALGFVMQMYTSEIVAEKTKNLVSFVQLYGVKEWEYNLVRFIFDYLRYLILLIVTFAIGILTWNTVFIWQSYLVLPTFLLWGLTQIGMGYIFALFFTSQRFASMFIFFFSMATLIIGAGLNLFVFDNSFPLIWYWLFPPFVFMRLFTHILIMRDPSSIQPPIWDFVIGFFILIVQTALMFLFLFVTQFIDFSRIFSFLGKNIFERLFLAIFYRTKVEKLEKNSKVENYGGQNTENVENSQKMNSQNLEENAENQMEEVIDPIVEIENISKFYHMFGRSKKALSDVSFKIEDKSLFGMLGPNGAGKTTLIKILTGEILPSKGNAKIAGYSVSSQISKIRQNIGICPQFDILWDELSVMEVLLFFARLRGVSPRKEKKAVKQIIEAAGLEEARRRQVKALSGGMKRRLSVAVALCGSPKVVFLDEPTTGLDPASKRGLWDVVLKAKKKHCVILTTHSMEEAEALCERIAIIVGGELATIGSLISLKKKYGRGYKITIICDNPEKDRAKIIDFMENEIAIENAGVEPPSESSSDSPTEKKVVLEEEYGHTLIFRASNESISLGNVFRKMSFKAPYIGIKDWAIQQASLEEVFLQLAAKQYHRE